MKTAQPISRSDLASKIGNYILSGHRLATVFTEKYFWQAIVSAEVSNCEVEVFCCEEKEILLAVFEADLLIYHP